MENISANDKNWKAMIKPTKLDVQLSEAQRNGLKILSGFSFHLSSMHGLQTAHKKLYKA